MAFSSQSMPQADSKFDLAKLTEFDPALIYGFEPEAEYKPINYPTTLRHSSRQFKDLLNAYLYTQNVVLKEIRKNGIKAITMPQFIDFMLKLHGIIAETLAIEHAAMLKIDYKELAGCFSTTEICRWHYGRDFGLIASLYAAGRLSTTDFHKKVSQENGNINDATAFIKLLKDIGGKFPLEDLVKNYQENKFSTAQKTIINKIVKIPDTLENLPKKTQKFVEELLPKIAACNPKDLDAVASLAYFIYNGIVQIHPTFNGNGRLAGCIMNMALVLLGHPSILIRHPGDRSDTKSNYAIAIEKIDTKPELLKELIKSRLQNPKFENKLLRKTVIAQVQLYETVTQLEAQQTREKADKLLMLNYKKFESDPFCRISAMWEDPDASTIAYTQNDVPYLATIAVCNATRKNLSELLKPNISQPNPAALFTPAKTINKKPLSLVETKLLSEVENLKQETHLEQECFKAIIDTDTKNALTKYALAFRKAASGGLDDYLKTLLKYYKELSSEGKFDINALSSNKKSALDWLEAAIEKEGANTTVLTPIKDEMLTLGAKSGLALRNTH